MTVPPNRDKGETTGLLGYLLLLSRAPYQEPRDDYWGVPFNATDVGPPIWRSHWDVAVELALAREFVEIDALRCTVVLLH